MFRHIQPITVRFEASKTGGRPPCVKLVNPVDTSHG